MMMVRKVKTVSASKARTHLASILKQVAKGTEIVITMRGRPVARLVSPLVAKKSDKSVYDKILALRGSIKLLKGETAKDLINAGRRI